MHQANTLRSDGLCAQIAFRLASPALRERSATGNVVRLRLARNLQRGVAEVEMKADRLTIAELSVLIAAHAEMRAKLRTLALEAYEQWRSVESQLVELENFLARARDDTSRDEPRTEDERRGWCSS